MATTYQMLFGTPSARDTPSVDASGDLSQDPGGAFVSCSRGYDRATLGAQPRAGDLTAKVRNVGLGYSLLSPRPGLGVGLLKDIGGTDYNLWQGTTDIPLHSIEDDALIPYVDVSALGVFSRLAGKTISTALYEEITTGAAMAVVLDTVGIPAALRDLDTGEVTLHQWWCEGDDAFEMLKLLRQSEGITADLYEDKDGRVTFRDRSARFDETRSNTIQSTVTSEGAEPRLTGIEWIPEYREIVNYAEHERVVLAADSAASVIWTDPNAVYIIPAGTTLTIDVSATSGLPFKNAITPVLNTDYRVGYGSVSTVTLDRTSGASTRITFTPGAAGAVIGGPSGGNIQLRATAFTQLSSQIEKSTVDASDSIATYDLKPWQGSMWTTMPWDDMRDNLNAIVRWLKDPHGRVTFGVLGNAGAQSGGARDVMTAAREIGDRINIVETDLGIDVDAWIERITHEITAPQRHFVIYECSVIDAEAALEEPGTPPTSAHGEVTGLTPESGGSEESASSSRHIVTIDDQVSYVFFDDEVNNYMSWSKTVDAGESWSAAVALDSDSGSAAGTNCYDVFYERWADPTLGPYVHIFRHQDAVDRGIWYVKFDIDTETVVEGPTKIAGSSAGPQNKALSIGVSKSGNLLVSHYTTLSGAFGYRSTDGGANWSACTSLSESIHDRLILMPDWQSADDDDLIGIYADYSAGEISVKRYDWSADAVASETSVVSGINLPNDVVLARHLAATMNTTTGHITLVATEQIDGTTGDIKAWDIYGTTITALTDVVAADTWMRNLGVSTDGTSIWVFYHHGATGWTDGQEYYKVSTDGGTTWGAETQFGTTNSSGANYIAGVILDPNPGGSLLAGYRIGNLYYFDDTLATVDTGTETSHEDNPFDSENASANLGLTVDVNDQGTMMRGLLPGLFGVAEI